MGCEDNGFCVAGDLVKNGWAIYNGSKVSSVPHHQMKRIAQKYSRRWQNIHKGNRPNDTARRDHLNLANIRSEEDDLVGLRILFNDILKNLKTVEGFQHASFDSEQVLRNIGAVPKQDPHRDYFPQEKNKNT